MRLLTAVCLGLTLAGLASGCTTMRNPLASKTDPQDASRRRMITEMNARTERGDIEGARRILAELESRNRSDTVDSSVIPLGSRASSSDPDDVGRLVDRLVAFDPPSLRQSNREKYQQFSPATLKQMLAEYERSAEFGQSGLNQVSPRPASPGVMYAQNAGDGDSAAPRQNVSENGLVAQRSAPDPRPAQSRPLGTQSPWVVAEQSPVTSSAPRLPESQLPGTSPHDPVAQREGLQTVSGEMPVHSGITGAALTGSPSESFAHTGHAATSPHNGLPVISPGNTGLSNPIIPAAVSAPAFPSSFGTVPSSNSGGVSLLNQIGPVDDSSSIPSQDITGFDPVGVASQGTSELAPFKIPGTTTLDDPSLRDPMTSQSRRPGVLESGVQGVQQIIPRIKDAAGRTLRNFGQTDPPLDVAPATGPLDVPSLIRTLETELLAAAPGQTDAERMQYVRRHVNLRMLHLVAGDVGQAVEPIPGIPAADQEFWQKMVWSISNYFDDTGMPDAGVRSAETIEQLRGAISQLGQNADLKLRNTTFCHRIVSFGNYERFKEDRFTTGQPVLLYAEIENFSSLRGSNDGYRTALQSTIELYHTHDMKQPLESIPFDTTEDYCRSQRRDYFHSYEFTVPPNLEPGNYTLILRVVDQQSRKVATSRVNFEVE